MAKTGLTFRIQIPKRIETATRSSKYVSIRPISVRESIGEESPATPRFLRKWTLNSLFSDEDQSTGYMSDIINSAYYTAEKTTHLLKFAFYDNLMEGASSWKSVSKERLARRAAFMNLTKRNILPVDPNVHYEEEVFMSAISNFRFEVFPKKSSITIKISSDYGSSRYQDFKKLRSSYTGPNEITLSRMGLEIRSNPGATGSGKKMIVPAGTSMDNIHFEGGGKVIGKKNPWVRKSMATLQGNKIVYPTRNNPNPSGVPINFYDKIKTHSIYFQNPSDGSKVRPVFWVQDKLSGNIRFPHNVVRAMKHGGLLPESVELEII